MKTILHVQHHINLIDAISVVSEFNNINYLLTVGRIGRVKDLHHAQAFKQRNTKCLL